MLKIQKRYMDTGSFIVHVKTYNIYKDIAEDFMTRFDFLNYEIDIPLPKGKNKKNNWNNEKLIRWTNHEKICLIKSKSI